MLLPVLKNFSMTRGVAFDYRFQWNQGVPTSTVPTDLSLYTAVLTINNYDGSVIYATLTSGASAGNSGIFYGGATHDPTNGIIDIVMTGSDTSDYSFQTARYNLQMTPIASPTLPIRLLHGTFNVVGS